MADDDQSGDQPEADAPADPGIADDALVEVSVKGLILDPTSNDPIVILRDEDGSRFLPIWIGVFEANAIALAMEGVEPQRPLSHDLMASLLRSLDASVARVAIINLAEGTFFAEILLGTPAGGELRVDARPSDAIALALRVEAPVFVAPAVFERAQRADNARRLADEEKLKKWLEDVDPEELGKYTM